MTVDRGMRKGEILGRGGRGRYEDAAGDLEIEEGMEGEGKGWEAEAEVGKRKTGLGLGMEKGNLNKKMEV